MASPFDGMGAALAGALGAPVTHLPAAGAPVTRRWHLRRYPEDFSLGEDRPVSGASAELRVPRDQLAGVAVGDRVRDGDGTLYRLARRMETENPGADALIPFELEEVTP
ncbi:hypothetical protein N0B44_15600 [Roseibacterium beibuensis]|uniref:Uncharacterized protein n=1 Tax=[Roseibacterium] beibuensis TaxID=1193142 RepID=A0ABP9L8Q5_9RHOB|nr:hypothetical protein [Roseibacterium beibuensis]MCS6624344.1 hypothetical protein [Roseibacterium beibuensis]